jgi:hypothetical protein
MKPGSWREMRKRHKNGILRPFYIVWNTLRRNRVPERILYFKYGLLQILYRHFFSVVNKIFFSKIRNKASKKDGIPFIMDNITIFCGEFISNAIKEDRKHEYIIKSPLSFSVVENAIVHPMELPEGNSSEINRYGGITDDKLVFMEACAHKRRIREVNGEYYDCYIGANPAFDRQSVLYADEEVVFGGFFHSHFGHFLTESLSRLWYFLDRKDDARRIVCIGDRWPPLRFMDLLNLFGINSERILCLERPVKFRSVIIPESSMIIWDKCHSDYKRTIDRIKAGIIPKKFKKVYFSKKFFGKRVGIGRVSGGGRAIGEDALCEIFKANGYKVFYPELMAMNDVISVLKGCESFAASSGTNAHLAVFMEDGAELICLNRSPHINYIQTMISLLFNINTIYVDSYIDLLPTTAHGPFLFGMNENLINFFEYRNFTYPLDKYYKEMPDNVCEFMKVWGDYHIDHDLQNGAEIFGCQDLAKKLSRYLYLQHEYRI